MESFLVLSIFPNLFKLRVKYDDISSILLEQLLNQSESLREVVLWERKKWIPEKKWKKMEFFIDSIGKKFPNRVIILEATV
jgi:hypothetical protein